MRPNSIDRAVDLLRRVTDSGEVRAAALLVRIGSDEVVHGFGQADPNTVFLLASITKPMTVAGVLILRHRGLLSLDDPVGRYLPEFHGGSRDRVTIRHLLTHTSGLPDMLPEDRTLRERHASLREFVAGATETSLMFEPGTAVSYQSLGTLLAAEIVERLAGIAFRDFLRTEVFGPLGMADTSLGLGGRSITQTARCQVVEQSGWDWNSAYWRDLGAPWGGAHSTVRDVATFLAAFTYSDCPILTPATIREMTSPQTPPEGYETWGLGWRVGSDAFGQRCSPGTFGHYGATGTVAWSDPRTNTACVLLTTLPAEHSRDHVLAAVSDLVSVAASAQVPLRECSAIYCDGSGNSHRRTSGFTPT